MGVIELQVFVSLVVILGAAFVALICDFLKGNNEQLRESNIVLRVREDERTRSSAIVEHVQERAQRQTLEVLAQVQRVSGQRQAAAAKPAPPQAAPTQAAADPAAAPDPVESTPRGYAERSSRVRRPRPNPAEASSAATVPTPIKADADATWAQDIILRRHPQAEPKPEIQPETQPQAEIASQPKPEPARTFNLEAFDIRKSAPPRVAAAQPPSGPVEPPSPAMAEHQHAIPLGTLAGQIRATAPAPTPEAFQNQPSSPACGLHPELDVEIRPEAPIEWSEPVAVEAPVPEMAAATEIPLAPPTPLAATPAWSGAPLMQEGAATVPSAGSQVATPLTPQMAGAATELIQSPLTLEASASNPPAQHTPAETPAALPVLRLQAEAPIFEIPAEAPLAPPAEEDPEIVRVRVLRDDDAPQESAPVLPQAAPEEDLQLAEPVLNEAPSFDSTLSLDEPFPTLGEILTPATLESEPWLRDAAQEAPAPLEVRSNVVEMPVSSLRPQEPEKPAVTELAIPGGFHEAASLARLMEDDRPFHGLVIAISVVDHVRLLADQGKPATEQLMATVTRLVVSMAREQDFACRIDEDEFILIFARETGAAAKRRIQLVSERLWDFQLRSLGSVSVIFSWGAAESQAHPLMQAVENAREQMMETRRNRRAYNSGANRFRRRTAN